MPVAAKCNITSSVLKVLDKIRGYDCGLRDKSIIYENYAEWLACSTRERIVCNPDNCVNETIIHPCEITGDIVYQANPDEGTIDFTIVNLGSYDAPLTFEWGYEADDFTLLSAINKDTLKLKVIPPKDIEILVSAVSVMITDAGGCTLTIICFMSPSGCTLIACPNPSNMMITNKIVRCPSSRFLVVGKKV